jgi:hypothetical protein
MSFSASEQQALDSIEATLTSADPKLASLRRPGARTRCVVRRTKHWRLT